MFPWAAAAFLTGIEVVCKTYRFILRRTGMHAHEGSRYWISLALAASFLFAFWIWICICPTTSRPLRRFVTFVTFVTLVACCSRLHWQWKHKIGDRYIMFQASNQVIKKLAWTLTRLDWSSMQLTQPYKGLSICPTKAGSEKSSEIQELEVENTMQTICQSSFSSLHKKLSL